MKKALSVILICAMLAVFGAFMAPYASAADPIDTEDSYFDGEYDGEYDDDQEDSGTAGAGHVDARRQPIRAAVHDWLAVSRHAGRIAAVRGAHPRHGGGGSLYIILRRQ